jgi:hypothetical protein
VIVNTSIASPLFTRLTDGTDTVAVNAASQLLVSASLTDPISINSASVTIVNNSTASVLYTSACITNLAGSAAGSPLFTSVTNTVSASISAGSVALLTGANVIGSASVIQSTAAAYTAPWPTKQSDGTDSLSITAASEALVFVNNTASVIVSSGSLVVTNALSASISGGSVALLTGANVIGSASVIQSTGAAITSPWAVKLSDGTDSAAVTSASEQLVFVNNVASAIVSSGSVTVINALSASISGGSIALLTGANTIGVASVIQGTAAAITAPWPVKVSDGTDSGNIDSASRLTIAITNSGETYGIPGSPLVVSGAGPKMYWGGSLLTINQIDLSSSVSGCTRIVASTAGAAIVILDATFTTSGCQRIGWIASGAGAASAAVQTPMPFGTNGGMDAKRSPDSYLWLVPSGSNAIITTTSACYVAGTITYITPAS